MQRVIPLIEDLRAIGIEVPPYPNVHAPLAEPGPVHIDSGDELQAKVDAFEARVVAWRAEVAKLHAKHCAKRTAAQD